MLPISIKCIKCAENLHLLLICNRWHCQVMVKQKLIAIQVFFLGAEWRIDTNRNTAFNIQLVRDNIGDKNDGYSFSCCDGLRANQSF